MKAILQEVGTMLLVMTVIAILITAVKHFQPEFIEKIVQYLSARTPKY